MKNIHLIPTNKARLYIHQGKLYDNKKTMHIPDGTQIPQNIYITNDLEIKEGWYFNKAVGVNKPVYVQNEDVKGLKSVYGENLNHLQKIILTTDQDLIKDNVQSIDDNFLEWFVKNQSCERVEVKIEFIQTPDNLKDGFYYKIIIPQGEDEQEEEVECNMCDSLMSYDEENGIYICTNSECTRCYEEYEEEPKQYPIGGYAPGYYSCTCVTCKKEFTGDKRAVQCEPCAIKMTREEPKQKKDLAYWKANAEEDYIKVPISVLRYITELEKRMYSEEDMRNAFDSAREFNSLDGVVDVHIVLHMGGDMSDLQPLHFTFDEWFEQYKKK